MQSKGNLGEALGKQLHNLLKKIPLAAMGKTDCKGRADSGETRGTAATAAIPVRDDGAWARVAAATEKQGWV